MKPDCDAESIVMKFWFAALLERLPLLLSLDTELLLDPILCVCDLPNEYFGTFYI